MHEKTYIPEKTAYSYIFYAEKPVSDTFFAKKLRERFSNLTVTRKNLSVSFSNLSQRVATDKHKEQKTSFSVT